MTALALKSPLELLRSTGLPGHGQEEWKYSNLRSAIDMETVAQPARFLWRTIGRPAEVEEVDIADAGIPGWALAHLPRNSSDDVMSMTARLLVKNGAAFRIPRGLKCSTPIHMEFGSRGHGQAVFIAEDDADVTIIETHLGDSDQIRNIWSLIYLGNRARVNHTRLLLPAADLVAVHNVLVVHGENSKYRSHSMTAGAKLSHTKFDVRMAREGSYTDINGVSVLNDELHADITTHVAHLVPNTTSRQLFKIIAGGHGRGVYQGKVTVAEGASGSDSRQTAKGLLLEDRAEIDLKPELEILADDVKCAHGAAVGDLDAESLFYLRSRGIPEAEARALLMRAFLGDAIAHIENEAARESVWQAVDAALERVS